MCGILGHIAPQRAKVLGLDALKHRGPDAQGSWMSPLGNVWLGHTRLAILDLTEAGSQPMKDSGGENVIVFNGEIYNHLEIRAELELLGVSFTGQSDTETILRGYGVWGPAIFRRLRGMFALAIYDAAQKAVVFARDRFGIKPLYLRFLKDGSLAFGSEVRALLPGEPATVSRKAISSYLHWGACPHRTLLIEDISEFPAGCWAVVETGKIEVRAQRFWPNREESVTHAGVGPPSEPATEPAVRVRELLLDAVKSHLLSDVPVACFLSGGIDSSILVAMAAREMGTTKLATFSVGFTESSFDESQFAQMMADQYHTDHHHITLSNREKLELVQHAVETMDLPSADAINTYIVSSKVAAAGYKVVLSGLGADEVFGGYDIFRNFGLFRGITAIPRPLRAGILTTGRCIHLLTDVPREKTGETLERWWRRIWNGDMLRRIGLPVPTYSPAGGPPLRDAMAELSWSEIAHYLRDSLLRDSDAMSMAHSIEIRVPFLDNALVDYVLRLPAGKKFNPQIPKSLLLQATQGLIPEGIWRRPKMGFGLPMGEWMKGPLKEYTLTGLGGLVEENIFNRRQTDTLWQGFCQSRVNPAAIWSASVLGHYLARVRKQQNGIPLNASSS